MRGWRRRDLIGAAALGAAGLPHRAAAEAEHGRLLVAGLPGGKLDAIAAVLREGLLSGLGPAATCEIHTAGGDDGVTGSNRFQAWFAGDGDGTPLLLLPGSAAAAWLAGDARARYDIARWLPLMCGVGSGALVSRQPHAMAHAGRPWRVAVGDPPGAGACCLLGLDLLNVPARPWPTDNAGAALASGQVDAAFLRGAVAREAGSRGQAVFALGGPDPADPTASSTPVLADMVRARAGADRLLARAVAATSAAALLDYALVLPALTPAASVAVWRAAAARLPETLGTLAPVSHLLAGPACCEIMAAISVEPAVLLAYRDWLGTRLGYSAG